MRTLLHSFVCTPAAHTVDADTPLPPHNNGSSWQAAPTPAAPLDFPTVFPTVARDESLVSRVTTQIEQMIHDRRLRTGDRLPSERTLAGQFGVSRTVVREAVRALAARELLHVQQGTGTLIRTPSVQTVSTSMRLLLGGAERLDHAHLLEVRRLLEVEIAGLAAQRRTEADLARLAQNLAEAPPLCDDRERFAQNDVDFHYALACATHNKLFPLFLDTIAPLLYSMRVLGATVKAMPERALYHHRAIFDAVARQEGDAARAAMRAHMAEAEQTIGEALAGGAVLE